MNTEEEVNEAANEYFEQNFDVRTIGPKDVREAFVDGALWQQSQSDNVWNISLWDNDQDTWSNFFSGQKFYGETVKAPTHWMPKPTPPSKP